MFGLDEMFGGRARGGRGRAGQRGFDLETQVELTLQEVAAGAEKTIEFEKQDVCDTCKGSGRQAGLLAGRLRPVWRAGACRPAGLRRDVPHGHDLPQLPGPRDRHPRPLPVLRRQRPADAQAHRHRQDPRRRPRGPGRPHHRRRRARRGRRPAGDLHCYIAVKPHPFFSRHNNDLVCQMPISFTQAALGARIQVPTLKSTEDLEVPPGTQHGEVFKLKGKGLPDRRTYRSGDELVQILVEIPQADRQAAATAQGVRRQRRQRPHAPAEGVPGQTQGSVQGRGLKARHW